MQKPVCKKVPYFHEWQGKKRADDYYWLHKKGDAEVETYLKQENRYTDYILQDTKKLQEEIYTEIVSRIQETDVSAPLKHGEFWYYTRTEKGLQYPIYCRKYQSLLAKEQVLLDQNDLAKDVSFCDIAAVSVSPDHAYVAYGLDTMGDERYAIFIKDIANDILLPVVIENTAGDVEWASDSSGIFYTTRDAAQRPDTVWFYALHTDITTVKEMYKEANQKFWLSLSKSKDEKYVLIVAGTYGSTEVLYMPATLKDDSQPEIVLPREVDHEYQVEHHEDSWYIVSNVQNKNFSLYKIQVGTTDIHTIKPFLDIDKHLFLEGIEVFSDFLCIYLLEDGITNIRVVRHSLEEDFMIEAPEEICHLQSGGQPEYENNVLRLQYSSLKTPGVVFEYDLKTRVGKTIKEQLITNHNPNLYEVERMYVDAGDGVKVPVTIVYRQDRDMDSAGPCLLQGYGSYGISEYVGFRNSLISLLDRGFMFAIAHVRGGGECGRSWYDNGKLLQKKNTFTDFIAVAEELTKQKYTNADQLVISGGSAGGLLVGAVTNERPDLFHAVLADVPFVDVLNTMCDDSLPLTVMEYNQWGDPHEGVVYDYIKSYAPYENVKSQSYPHILAIAGYNDSRVMYFEAAKWTAKLREYNTSNSHILLKVEMSHGHAGASARYQFWHDTAYRLGYMVWILTQSK